MSFYIPVIALSFFPLQSLQYVNPAAFKYETENRFAGNSVFIGNLQSDITLKILTKPD
jgi:hypothetical protein